MFAEEFNFATLPNVRIDRSICLDNSSFPPLAFSSVVLSSRVSRRSILYSIDRPVLRERLSLLPRLRLLLRGGGVREGRRCAGVRRAGLVLLSLPLFETEAEDMSNDAKRRMMLHNYHLNLNWLKCLNECDTYFQLTITSKDKQVP